MSCDVQKKAREAELLEVPTAAGPLLVPCVIRRSPRARHIRVSLGYDQTVHLSLPPRCPLRDGVAFLRSQGDWLSRAMGSRRKQLTLEKFLLRRGTVSAGGHSVRVRVSFTTVRPFYVFSLKERELALRITTGRGCEAELTALLTAFAREVLLARARELAARQRLRIGRITVRDQHSRWGSCSSSRTLSLNWRLVLLPPELQDYILWHELAHLREMNHSPRFWKVLEQWDPQAREHDQRITRDWNHLIALGRNA